MKRWEIHSMWVSTFLRPVSLLGYYVRLPDEIWNMGCAAEDVNRNRLRSRRIP